MKLSNNLSLSEVTKSNTAIRRGIDNTPTDLHIINLKYLAEKEDLKQVFIHMVWL